MLGTSQDILNLVKTVSIFVISALIAWILFYLAMIMHNLFKLTKEIREQLKKIDELVSLTKEKIEHSATYLLLIGEGVKKIAEFVHEYMSKKQKDK